MTTGRGDTESVDMLGVLSAALRGADDADVPGLLFRVSKIKYAGQEHVCLSGSPRPFVEIGQDGRVSGEDGDILTTSPHPNGFVAVVHGVYRNTPYSSERIGPCSTRADAVTAGELYWATMQNARDRGIV